MKLLGGNELTNIYLSLEASPQVGTALSQKTFFYRLAMKAKNAVAEAFQAKVADEILPSIRKHGGYLTPQKVEEVLTDPDTIIRLATQLKNERETKQRLQQQIALERPKVVFAEALETSPDSILIADLAKLLKQNGFSIGEVRLFKWMREQGYLIKSGSEYNMPTQRSMELGIMEIKVGQRASASDGIKQTRTPKITGKGLSYFINKFKEAAEKLATPEGQAYLQERKRAAEGFVGILREKSKPFNPSVQR